MKFFWPKNAIGGPASLPVRGAWIEIRRGLQNFCCRMSLPVRGAWIEIPFHPREKFRLQSLPVRGAWIEIQHLCGFARLCGRSPCGERGLK